MWKPLILLVVLIAIAVFITLNKSPKIVLDSTPSPSPNASSSTSNNPQLEIVATNLEVPWALAFLPDNSILVTERKGTVRMIDKNGNLSEKSLATILVKQTGESGLHGIAPHPDFDKNKYIYLYYTYSSNNNDSLNRVSRFTYQNNNLTNEKIIVDRIPGATIHDGGRIKFGPDGYLYITTGDAANPSLAQDKNSLAGKILKVKDEGTAEVVSSGHRNPQGIAWDKKELWEVEHGQSATDEINLIVEGKNYGWPTIRGDEKKANLESPILHSNSDTWAPGGMAFFEGSLYFGGLRGTALFEYNIETKNFKEHFKGEFGRIRDVVVGPDDMLYITTSNKDGRGTPQTGDDKIIRVDPKLLD